jgi:hypothetical protein
MTAPATQPSDVVAVPCPACDGSGETGHGQFDRELGWTELRPCRACDGCGERLADAGYAGTVVLLITAFIVGFLGLAVLHLGERAMCVVHDGALVYCQPAEATP